MARSSWGVAAGDDVGGCLLDFNVGRHALVFHDPALLGVPDGEVGGGDRGAVHQLGEAEDADEAAPCALADDRAGVGRGATS